MCAVLSWRVMVVVVIRSESWDWYGSCDYLGRLAGYRREKLRAVQEVDRYPTFPSDYCYLFSNQLFVYV